MVAELLALSGPRRLDGSLTEFLWPLREFLFDAIRAKDAMTVPSRKNPRKKPMMEPLQWVCRPSPVLSVGEESFDLGFEDLPLLLLFEIDQHL